MIFLYLICPCLIGRVAVQGSWQGWCPRVRRATTSGTGPQHGPRAKGSQLEPWDQHPCPSPIHKPPPLPQIVSLTRHPSQKWTSLWQGLTLSWACPPKVWMAWWITSVDSVLSVKSWSPGTAWHQNNDGELVTKSWTHSQPAPFLVVHSSSSTWRDCPCMDNGHWIYWPDSSGELMIANNVLEKAIYVIYASPWRLDYVCATEWRTGNHAL